MLEIILLVLFFISGIIMLFSGVWILVEVLLLFRIQLTNSLNASLDIIRVIKSHKADGVQDKEQKSQLEKEEIAIMEHLLTTLSDIHNRRNFIARTLYGSPQITFEMAVPSNGEQISFYISMPSIIRELVEKQIHSFYPDAHIEQVKDYTIFSPGACTAGSFLNLKKKSAYPVRTYQQLETDPLHSIANALSKLENESEGAAIQLVLRKGDKKGKIKGEKISQKMQQGKRLDNADTSVAGDIAKGIGKEMLNTLSKKEDEGFKKDDDEVVNLTPEENEVIKQIEAKANKAQFDVNIRLLASAETQERAEMILAQIENCFVQFEDSNLNKFIAVRDKSGNAHKLAYHYILRNFNLSKSINLGIEEIASIFHFPISTTETPKINLLKSKTAPPPASVPKEGLLIGYSDYRGTETEIKIGKNDRRRHLYMVGQTGTGKSTFIEEMAKQDAQKEGMCIIDPHGDLIDHVLECIPKERAEDIIYFNPSDIERPFGFNLIEYDESRPEQKTFVINELIAIFDKLYDLKQTGGPMFEQYMRNALLLVLDSPEIGSTLLEIPRIFRDPEFRKEKLKRCKDFTVVEFWEKEAENAGGDAALENIAPYINSKLATFISNDMMRPIISQQKSTIDFRELMDDGKILLVNLSKGKLGEINSHLLGMIIVGKLLMAALSRGDMDEDKRKDFYLYIDEFQNFTTDSISQILSEARKYRLCLTVAHQFIGQLSEDISKAVFGNVGSICSFRVGPEDADFLEKQFAPVFDANDLINVDNYQCFSKLLINNESSNAFDMKTYKPTEGSAELREAYKELSRYKYGRSKEVVEQEILERYNSFGGAKSLDDLKNSGNEELKDDK